MSVDTSATSSQQTRRLVFVDLLRGFACLWVLYCHFHGVWLDNVRSYGWSLDTLLIRIAGYGGKGVDLFVVLSGFCLFYPILRRADEGKRLVARDFYRRRAMRIFPVYYGVLAVSVLLVSVPALRTQIAQFRGFRDVLPHLLLIQNYLPDYIGRINGPLWSVALECQLYLLMPVWVWLFLRKGPLWPLAIAAAVSVAAGVLGMREMTWHGVAPFAGHGLPVRLYEFVAGMAAAWLVLRPQSWHVPAAVGTILCLLPLAILSQTRHAQHILQPAGTLLWGTTFASLVILASRLEGKGALAHQWLSPLAWLGLISYSVYAIHFPVILLAKPLVAPLLTSIQATFVWCSLLGIPAVLAAGYLVFVLVERYSVPSIRRQPFAQAPVASPSACAHPDERGQPAHGVADRPIEVSCVS